MPESSVTITGIRNDHLSEFGDNLLVPIFYQVFFYRRHKSHCDDKRQWAISVSNAIQSFRLNNKPATRRRHLVGAISVMAMLCCVESPLLAAAKPVIHQNLTHANLLRLAFAHCRCLLDSVVWPQDPDRTLFAPEQALARRLSGFLDGNIADACSLDALQLAFEQAVCADFSEGRCISVDGWLMANSEVELWTIAASAANA